MDIFVWCVRWDEKQEGIFLFQLFPVSHSLCLTILLWLDHFISRKWISVGQVVKFVSLKQMNCLVCDPSVLFRQGVYFCYFFIAIIYDWSSHLIYHEWVCVPIDSLCLLSSMKSVCSQRSYRLLSGSITHPHKFTEVHMFHQARSVQTAHIHTHTHTYTNRSLMSGGELVGISLRLCLPTAAGHFNDVTYADLCSNQSHASVGVWAVTLTLCAHSNVTKTVLVICIQVWNFFSTSKQSFQRHHRCVHETILHWSLICIRQPLVDDIVLMVTGWMVLGCVCLVADVYISVGWVNGLLHSYTIGSQFIFIISTLDVSVMDEIVK